MLFRSKGLPGSEGTLKKAAPKEDKRIAYEAAVKAAANEPKDGATTMKKKAAEKLAAKSAPAEAEAPVDVVESPVSQDVVSQEVVTEATPEAAAE